MASNHGVVYLGPGKVEVQSIDYPELKTPPGKRIDHGVIIKPTTTNICGSDQHMVRGRTAAPSGLVLGHEITGEEKILRVPEVDCAVDCVGFEAKGHGGKDEPAVVLNQLMEATRAVGAIGIPGLYVTEDPGAKDEAAKSRNLTMRLGLGWAKSHSFTTGQTPVMRYNRSLMMAILHDRIKIAKAVNVEIRLAQAGSAATTSLGITRRTMTLGQAANLCHPMSEPEEQRLIETISEVFR